MLYPIILSTTFTLYVAHESSTICFSKRTGENGHKIFMAPFSDSKVLLLEQFESILRTFESRTPELMLTLWKSLVIPILDYCSQLWSPSKVGEIQQIEEIQQSFTRKIRGNCRQDYWQRLKHYHLYSLQRRRERYRIIYTWKILEGIVPNLPDRSKVFTKQTFRTGRLCVIPPTPTFTKNRLQRLREGSFCVNGPKLFNTLPSNLWNMTQVSQMDFKNKLDKFLWTVADEPLIRGYTAGRRAESNSLQHMIGVSQV